jgi:fumarylacetoacetate (FAA) hydrolase family protein
MNLSATHILPDDAARALLIGRAFVPAATLPAGPSPVCVRDGEVFDLSHLAPTCSQLLNLPNPAAAIARALPRARAIGGIAELLANSAPEKRSVRVPYLLSPADLQAVRACGVTFVSSMLERVIEEHAKGDPDQADSIRHSIGAEIGGEISRIKPGSEQAARLKESFIKRGLWSQYLEVGIGADAEVFNKAQPLSSVGAGAEIGILRNSTWNNPEPEVVLVINARAQVVGCTLGNDVNLRDWEGRSALLLSRAKDNNASCALGPLIRLFDANFSIDDMRATKLTVDVEGRDGFHMQGKSDVATISRDPLDLVTHAMGRNHQYPDGVMLFLGTQFAPIQDRDEPGHGFTHKVGDVVSIRAPRLGALVNRVNYCDVLPPWEFGVGALMMNLRARGLL